MKKHNKLAMWLLIYALAAILLAATSHADSCCVRDIHGKVHCWPC